jgi:hypothetical protein
VGGLIVLLAASERRERAGRHLMSGGSLELLEVRRQRKPRSPACCVMMAMDLDLGRIGGELEESSRVVDRRSCLITRRPPVRR